MKKYVIVEKQYNYNDEIYYLEVDGGVPKYIKSSQEEAINMVKDLNKKTLINSLKNGDISMYFYPSEMKFVLKRGHDKAVKDILGIDDFSRNLDIESLIHKLSDSKKEELAEHFNLEFYELYEVDEND